jgi:DNA repair protein RecO (recombination protein O)
VRSTTAILLRKRKFSDTSLIVSWCTESLGCIQTVAKGARRPKSPFAGKLDLFFEADIAIAPSRKSNLHTLTEVALRNPFAGIRKNYLRTQTAAYFVELIEVCTERDHHEPELFALLRRAFGYLDKSEPNLRAVSHFEAELARITGVHDAKMLKNNPAFALGNLFGKLPLSRTPLLKALASDTKTK